MQTSNSSRRQFLRAAGAASLSLTALQRTWSAGANDDIRVVVIGLNGRGKGHMKTMLGMPGVRLVGLCDVDEKVLQARQDEISKAGKPKPKEYRDFRKVCADPEVDAVMIATPNHTHTLIAMTAIAGGKHVYVEKPVCHNLKEGRLLAEAAAKRPNLVVAHGMQRRSDTGWREAIEWLKAGNLGKPKLSLGLNFKERHSIGKVAAPVPPPASVDYDLWCGPRETKPIRRKQFHYDWHWQWDYGNGDIGNQGPHQMDVARWLAGHSTLPKAVMSVGGRFGYQDDGETPNTQIAVFDYDSVPIHFDNRGLPRAKMDWEGGMPNHLGLRIGNVLVCEGGTLAESKVLDPQGKMIRKFTITDGAGHEKNWVAAVRQGKLTDPNLAVINGHLSAGLSHMANISYRLGHTIEPGQIAERLQSDKEATELFGRFREHLAADDIDITKTLATCGPLLRFDPEKETFIGEFAAEANKLTDESYRTEFALPKIG